MNKIKKAVAIKYNRAKDRAPKIVAKGRNAVAERIIKAARDSNVPLYSDKDLVQILETLDIDYEIPPELYRAVAEVLVFIYSLNGKLA